MKAHLATLAASLVLAAAGLAAYDRWIVRPTQLVGVLDLNEVYHAKEAEFTAILSANPSEDQRKKAMDMAQEFARRLPVALERLPQQCQCLVILKSAVAGSAQRTVDLTPLLRTNLEEK